MALGKAEIGPVVYWMRADLEWHPYDPVPAVGTIETFLMLVEEDKHCCFFG